MKIFLKSHKDDYYDLTITTNYALDVILLIDDTKTPTHIHSVATLPPTRPPPSEDEPSKRPKRPKSTSRR